MDVGTVGPVASAACWAPPWQQSWGILFARDAVEKFRLGVVVEEGGSFARRNFAEGRGVVHLFGDFATVSLDAADEEVEALACSGEGGTLVATFFLRGDDEE